MKSSTPRGVRTWWGRALGACAAITALSFSPDAAAQLPTEADRAPAQNRDGIDTHLFRPAIDSKGFFTTNGSSILGANDISFGLILDYGRGILPTANDGEPGPDPDNPSQSGSGTDFLVEDSFQGTFKFNYGLANWAVIGISLPVILMNGSEAFQIGDDAGGGLYNSGQLGAQKVSNFSFHGKLRLTRVEKGPGLALAVQAGVPLANAARDLGADPGFWYWPQAIFEHRFGVTGRTKIGLNAGYRAHGGTDSRFGLDTQGQPQLEEGILEGGNKVTYSAGISWRALQSLDLVLESYGTYLVSGDSDSAQLFSHEAVGGIKLFIERQSFLMLGGGTGIWSTGYESADVRGFIGFVFEPSIGDRDGDGYKDDEDECPDDPEDFDGFKDEDGCPEPDNDNDGILDVDDRCPNVPEDKDGDEDEDGCPEASEGDRDGDGILDSRDKCPDDPEDKDGFEDKDGCPDPDNDKDGILDVDDGCPFDPEDKDNFEDEDGCPEPDNDRDQIPDAKDDCPNDPETYNGLDDEDGCPDKGKVIIEGSDILILEKILFETNSAEIKPESMPIIDAVATTLKHHPEFEVIEVGGHADERSSDRYNLKLTQDRVQSVVNALASRGVKRDRLIAQGYGEYCPLDTGHNPKAWEKNRRVEFKVVKTEDGTTGVDRGCDAARNKGVFPKKVDDDDDE